MAGLDKPGKDVIKPTQGGRVLAHESLEDSCVSVAAFAGGLRVARHVHESVCLTLVLSGRFLERHDHRDHAVEEGSILVKPPGEAHACEIGRDGSRLVFLEYEPVKLDTLLPCRPFDGVVHERSSRACILARQIERELSFVDDFSLVAVEGLSLEVVATISRAHSSPPRTPPPWLERVWEMLHERFLDVPGCKDLAEEAGVHPSTLSRAFRNSYGMGMAEYARQIRLEWASHELVHSSRPIATIAQEAGFTDQSHFTRWFKRFSGLTPAEFRRLRRP